MPYGRGESTESFVAEDVTFHPNGPETAELVARLADAKTTPEALERFHEIVRNTGFSDFSYLSGQTRHRTDNQPGLELAQVSHFSTCSGDWLEHLVGELAPEEDYDIQRMMLGHLSPFVSGANILPLMGPVAKRQREILLAKAKAGFAANFIVPLPRPPFIGPCHSAIMLISEMSATQFQEAMQRWGTPLISLSHLLHYMIGDDAQFFLDHAEPLAITLPARPEAEAHGSPAKRSQNALTDRQVEVVELLASGSRIEQIADMLGLARPTVDHHVREARKALGVTTTLELVARAVAIGLVSSKT